MNPLNETDALREKAQAVYSRLMDAFGEPDWTAPLDPLSELVSTILSQNTNDRNRDLAFNRLRAAFDTWDAVRDADPEAVMDAIRPAGLANQKGPRIQTVLRQISDETGGLDLNFLRELPAADAMAWLQRFKGVGPKTASIVLQFSLGKPAFPVDTHVYRVSGRIGLRPQRMTVEQAHVHLAGLFTPEQYGAGHLNLIYLGRRVCHARKPDCLVCPVQHLCDFFAAYWPPAASRT